MNVGEVGHAHGGEPDRRSSIVNRAELRTMAPMRVVCLLLFTALGASAHAAGLTLELVGLDSGQPIHQTVYVTGSLLASDGEMVDATGKLAPRTMIFDAAKKTVTVIDANQKSYRVLDEAQLRQMGQRMAQARAQAVSRAAMLPPDRRAAMAAMMERHGLSGDLDLGFSATGEKKKVGGFVCEVYHVTNHDRPFRDGVPGALSEFRSR